MDTLSRSRKHWLLSAALLGTLACSTDRNPEPAGRADPASPPVAAPTGSVIEFRSESVSSTPPSELDRPAAPAVSTPAPTTPGSVTAPPAPAPSGPLPAAREVGGLRITPRPDGSIRIEGNYRWGGDATTTYESVEYLEPALSVLERQFTPEQVEALRAVVAELRAR